MNTEPNPDRLRQVLRQGDPAAQEPGLSDHEVHAMRRAVLTATAEPRRRLAWFPLIATGTAALALAVAFGPWHRAPAPSSPMKSLVQVAAVSPPLASRPAVQATAVAPLQEPVKRSKPVHRHGVRTRKVLPIHHDDAPTLTASLPVREIQFSTPGGTRVIWELSGGSAR